MQVRGDLVSCVYIPGTNFTKAVELTFAVRLSCNQCVLAVDDNGAANPLSPPG